MKGRLAIALLVVGLAGCRKDEPLLQDGPVEPFMLDLPAWMPAPPVPADNPLTRPSVELGRHLFFEPRLSRTGTLSCAGCHFTDRAFSDTVALSLGVAQQPGLRNSPTLANVAYHPALFRDGGVPTLELQVLAPIHDDLEMDHSILTVADELRDEEPYRSLSQQAYGRPLDPYVITRAIANYERTLISGWSRFDRYMYQGEASALTESEVRGWELFSGPVAGCTACHGGFDLSDHSFRNVGQYSTYTDPGRARISLDPADEGKFKVPTLRNIALTAPYMHDGAMATLGEVVDHFASGGVAHPNKDPLMTPFTLTAQERADLLAFLNALTDERSLDQVP
ncbi:MAG TPA: cytochrome c peroxidase [Flavobacteriales bacterium]|nr:cytochrome c peroxidase [Flavobacteriales bacterium]HMR26602.1 cytochrome c peroxidase [Flavobacteriales bacterium]